MQVRIHLGAIAALAFAACSSSSASDTGTVDAGFADAAALPDAVASPDASDPDAEPSADTGVAEECTRNASDRCDMITWTSTSGSYPVRVDHHTTLVTEADDGTAYLVVIGGILSNAQGGADDVYTAVRRAPIAPDGTLGEFKDDPPLPSPKAFHGQVVHRNFVYLMAGVTADASGAGASTTVLWGKIEGDGSLQTWQSGNLPREVRIHPSANILGDTIYVIGGSGAQGRVLDTVIAAKIADDGTPGTFTATVSLPAPRSHHTSIVANDHIYVLGGFDADQNAQPDILRSVHDAAGMLTGWESIGQLTETPWTSSAILHRGWVVLVGGGEGDANNARFVDRVRAAPFMADGTLGPFEDVDAVLPKARSHVHQTPVHEGYIYSVGGRIQNAFSLSSYDGVFVGRLW